MDKGKMKAEIELKSQIDSLTLINVFVLKPIQKYSL